MLKVVCANMIHLLPPSQYTTAGKFAVYEIVEGLAYSRVVHIASGYQVNPPDTVFMNRDEAWHYARALDARTTDADITHVDGTWETSESSQAVVEELIMDFGSRRALVRVPKGFEAFLRGE